MRFYFYHPRVRQTSNKGVHNIVYNGYKMITRKQNSSKSLRKFYSKIYQFTFLGTRGYVPSIECTNNSKFVVDVLLFQFLRHLVRKITAFFFHRVENESTYTMLVAKEEKGILLRLQGEEVFP